MMVSHSTDDEDYSSRRHPHTRSTSTKMMMTRMLLVAAVSISASIVVHAAPTTDKYATKSGLRIWVDPATPEDRQAYVSSRGQTWELVMSDEFDTPDRSFKPGQDHMWTSINKPDGVNAALEVYSHNMTTTKCDDDGTCYFQIEARDTVIKLKLWNNYQARPGYQNFNFYYRSGMVQSWNKFCYQGGMLEVKAQLPGAVSPESKNPDLRGGSSSRIRNKQFYPTWPGIWMMGNLGRALFSASTDRMWPFSYNECNEAAFNSSNQRISACNENPGYGLNPRQGRGAPEIDILEGVGNEVSSSVQIGPGMPMDFRVINAGAPDGGKPDCQFTYTCKTKGSNGPDIPTLHYKSLRGYKTWYQGLRYGANNFCESDGKERQDFTTVENTLKSPSGIAANECSTSNCPGSKDPNSDLSLIDGVGPDHWGINSNGTCFSLLNGYYGAYLCSPGNKGALCKKEDIPPNPKVTPFQYQMDAISANWGLHVGAYTEYVVYQVEWVMGSEGYVRWMLAGSPLYEIPASAVEQPPQAPGTIRNPRKIMIEEPMYIIMNVALSSVWGTKPPNPGGPCRGGNPSDEDNRICDAFPMYLKVDYIRLYQDVSPGSNMSIGCDPSTHPTRQWIKEHISEYQDYDNPVEEVRGRAFCRNNDDCTIGNLTLSKVPTGKCVKNRCECAGAGWTGPRCTMTLSAAVSDAKDPDGVSISDALSGSSEGPPFEVALGIAALSLVLTTIAVYYSLRQASTEAEELKKRAQVQHKNGGGAGAAGAFSLSSPSDIGWKGPTGTGPQSNNHNYATNFV